MNKWLSVYKDNPARGLATSETRKPASCAYDFNTNCLSFNSFRTENQDLMIDSSNNALITHEVSTIFPLLLLIDSVESKTRLFAIFKIRFLMMIKYHHDMKML